MSKSYKGLQDAFQSLCEQLKGSKEVYSRGFSQKEEICQNFCIEDPTDILIEIPDRKFSKIYALTEWLWYLSANSNTKNIGKMAKIWRDISDADGNVESNYGMYIIPQWDWVKKEILSDKDTRRATIVINQPYHKNRNPKDYPCTQYVQFLVRQDKLHMSVNMRSNDLIYGLCNDVFTFCLFQQLMLNELNHSGLDLTLGKYYHHAGSLHVYDKHYEMLDNIVSGAPYGDSTTRLILNPGVTLSGCPSLPGIDMPKEEIRNYTTTITEKFFYEYSR